MKVKNRISIMLVIALTITLTTGFIANRMNEQHFQEVQIAMEREASGIDGWSGSTEDVMNEIRQGRYATDQVSEFVNKGYLSAYVDELKTLGYLSADTANENEQTPITQGSTKDEAPKVEITVTDMSATMYVTSQVNVRNGASSDFTKIGTLQKDQEVTVTGQASTGWYRIIFNNVEGYVSDKYLTTQAPVSEVVKDDETGETEIAYNSEAQTAGHRFLELNDDAENAFIILSADDEKDNCYLDINEDAKDKCILGAILTVTDYNGEDGKINFVDNEENMLYSYKFSAYKCGEDAEYNLALDIKEQDNKTILTFEQNAELPQNVEVTVKMNDADTLYYIYTGTEYTLFEQVTSDENGYITFDTKNLTEYTVSKLDLIGKESANEEEVQIKTEQLVKNVENDTSQSNYNFIAISIVIVIAIVSVISVVIYKKKRNK